MKYALFESLGDEYPYALERRHGYIVEKIVELWDRPEIDDYFTSLLIDTRGGRKGFEPDVFKDIRCLYKFRESERLREAQSKFEVMRELEQRGVNFNVPAFLEAVRQGDQRLVDLFVRGGINVNASDDDKSTALQIALKSGFTVIALILLKAGADVNVRDAAGFTPLLMACGKTTPGYKEVAEKLVLRGADPNARDPLGWTPLLLAISAGNAELVNQLLENGASPMARTRRGENAKDLAQKFGHENLVDLLGTIGTRKSDFLSQTFKWL